MVNKTNKPRLVFFQWKHEGLPKFLQLHIQQHVKCLSEFFDVVLINYECDYRQICDMYRPDLTLFEGGYKSTISNKITIKNTSAYSEIPKLGLHNGDGWCESRVSFFSQMEEWGVETFFSISITTAEHTPEIAENLFVWPNFIDSDIYHDYGESKLIPILFNGSMIPLYPWRQKIYKILSNCYPSLIFPHLGYESNSSLMIYGEQYARTINASWFVPACGTVAKEIVRKHFEVPGSKACLITEKSPALEAAGFVDMQNCIFADEKDVLDKLNYLFKNTPELEKIINAGYKLVHANHTTKQRDQIYQWFNLYKNLKSNEKIVQSNPFKPLSIVEKTPAIKNLPITCNGLHLEFLHKGDEKLWMGKYDEAEALYSKCLNFIPWMSEPKLKLAVCSLYKGNAENALNQIVEPIQNQLGAYKASEPDPIEWAYYIITLFCKGDLSTAIIRAKQFPLLHHPELDRTRWVVDYLQNKENIPSLPDCQLSKPRYSIHQFPHSNFLNWIGNLCIMLKACQQFDYAETLSISTRSKEESSNKLRQNHVGLLQRYFLPVRIYCVEKLNYIFEILHIPNRRLGLPSISINDYIIRLGKWVKVESISRVIGKFKSHSKNYLN